MLILKCLAESSKWLLTYLQAIPIYSPDIEIISVTVMSCDELSDLNLSGRKSSAGATNDAFHIAFGSKISGVPTAMSAGRKSSKEVIVLLPSFV